MADDERSIAPAGAVGASPPIWSPKRCVAGRRLFLGFARPRLERVLDGLGGRILGPPEISSYRDVVIQPLRRLAPRQFVGGVYQDGRFVDALALRRGTGVGLRQFNEADPARPIDAAAPSLRVSRAWFGGFLANHYGHFLLDGLARVLGAEVRRSADPILFLNPHHVPRLTPWMEQVLRQCGLDPARIIVCDAATAVDELRVQETSFVVRDSVRPSIYADIPRAPAAPGGGTLYLSRGNPRLRRRIAGEAQLEARLAGERGVVLLHPETLPIPAQLAALGSAGTVLGCEGSAFHSLLLLQRPPRAILLCDGRSNLNFLLADELIAGDVAYVMAAEARGSPDGWTMDVDAALAGIAEAERLLG